MAAYTAGSFVSGQDSVAQEAARLEALAGIQDSAPDMAEAKQVFVQPLVFSENLDWMLKVVRDEPGLSFGMLGLNLQNWSELEERLGEPRALALAQSLVERTESALGAVDLAAWPQADAVHLLLPNDDARRIPALRKTLRAWRHEAAGCFGVTPHLRFTEVRVNGQVAARETAESLMENLGGGRLN